MYIKTHRHLIHAKRVSEMEIDTSKLDRIVDFVGMFKSFDEIKREWKLSSEELELLKYRAE